MSSVLSCSSVVCVDPNILREHSVCISRSKLSNRVLDLENKLLLQELHTQQHSMKHTRRFASKVKRHSGFCTSQAEARKNERSQLRQTMMKDKHITHQSQHIWLQMQELLYCHKHSGCNKNTVNSY
jgi:hypothetical protein